MRLRSGVLVLEIPGGHHATYSTPVPLRPYRPRMEPTGEPLLASPEKRGRPPKWPAHLASLMPCSTCCEKRLRLADALPREYPPWQTVYYHFRKWRLDGRLRQAHDRLPKAVREAEGRARDPSGAVIDSQALIKATGVGGPQRGYDGTTAPSASPAGSATCSWRTPAGSCWVRTSTRRACTTATVVGKNS